MGGVRLYLPAVLFGEMHGHAGDGVSGGGRAG